MKYSISFWNTISIENCQMDLVKTWHELGITVAMSPSYKEKDKNKVLEILDAAHEYDMKVILCDYRTDWNILSKQGEENYRNLFREALDDFGYHPATYGFFIGDEPDATQIADALAAMRIQMEEASQLTCYLNLLPWFDWIGKRMGTDALSPYLDKVAKEGKAKLLSYDCYTQMWQGESGYDVYFNNLREYYLATKRLQIPYWNIVLSCGHYYYRCPSKEDLTWQLSTSVAHGALGVSWFFIQLPDLWENYRNAPINQFGERTKSFDDLSEVNRLFNAHCGEIISQLQIDTCYHVEKAYGGNKLFEPFGNVLSVTSENKVPLIFSRFQDKDGNTYYIACCNSPEKTTMATVKFKETVLVEKCQFGNRFVPLNVHTDPIGEREGENSHTINVWLSPGQLVLLKEL